jgi:phage-related protein
LAEKPAFVRGPEADRRGYQDGGIWLAKGMPVCRPLGDGIYEVRTSLAQNRIARVLFYIDKKSRMLLLHGFIKKTQKTPDEDLELAKRNKSKHQRGLK